MLRNYGGNTLSRIQGLLLPCIIVVLCSVGGGRASNLDWHYCMGVDVMSGDGNFSILASSGNIGPGFSGQSGWVSTMDPPTCCSSECAPVTQEPEGWIALITRGNCSFVQKILNAQQAGASAVVVSNNQGHDQLVIMGGHSAHIGIPSVFVSHDSGEILRQYVDSSVSDGVDTTSGLEIAISPCGASDYYTWDDGNVFLPDYMLLLLVFSTMLCSMCTVGLIRWRIHLLYPEAAPPVEEQVVINLPQRICTESEDKECCICLEPFEVDDTVRILPCRHEYHAQCIDKWLTTHHRTCPICKGDITQTNEDDSEADVEENEPRSSPWYSQVAGWFTLRSSEHAYSNNFAETELEIFDDNDTVVMPADEFDEDQQPEEHHNEEEIELQHPR